MNVKLRAAYRHLSRRLKRDEKDELGNVCIDMEHARAILDDLEKRNHVHIGIVEVYRKSIPGDWQPTAR